MAQETFNPYPYPLNAEERGIGVLGCFLCVTIPETT
jgi:hypothetical protein